MPSPLADLDELTLKCRDEKSKKYIKEAVGCYKSGAFRAAIVSTWIAVTFDLIDKFKELATLGDKIAEQQILELEKAKKQNDIPRFLQLERDIVNIARDKLELVSHTESLDLERLQEDRNRCAHPSMNADGEIFNPSAELARLHIHSAVTHLLQHPPAQGKYALDRLIDIVESKYFPMNVIEVIVALKHTPLLNPKFSLLRNFIVVMIKKSLDENIEYRDKIRYYTSLNAVHDMHMENYNKILHKDLSKILSNNSDNNLANSLEFISNTTDSWLFLDEALKLKIKNFISNIPSENFEMLEYFIDKDYLSEQVKNRISIASEKDIHQLIPFDMNPLFIDRLIEIYEDSLNFSQANDWVVNNYSYISNFSHSQIKRIIKAASNNDQINGSFEIKRLLRGLVSSKKISIDEINALLTEFDLEELLLQ